MFLCPVAPPARVEVYADAALVNPIASGETATDGTFNIALPPGEYYVIVNLDADRDGKYSEGDSLGGYGTLDITTTPPAPITLNAGENLNIELLLSARYDANGHLHATPPSIEAHIDQGTHHWTHHLGWQRPDPTRYLNAFIYTQNSLNRLRCRFRLTKTVIMMSMCCRVSTTSWRLWMLIRIGQTGITDGVGIYGTRYPARGTPAAISVFPGETTSHINIEILASYIDEDGNMAEIDDGGRWEIKRRFGEPEDVFSVTRNGRVNESWKYWSKGIGYLWQANGAGWELGDMERFVPKQNIAETDKSIEGSGFGTDTTATGTEQNGVELLDKLPGFIYFDYDNIVWGYGTRWQQYPLWCWTHANRRK